MMKRIGSCFCMLGACFFAACIPYPTSPDGTIIEGGYEGARSVTMGTPAGDRVVPEGTLVTISWSSFNDTDVDATLTVVAEGQSTLTTTTIASGVAIAADSGSGSVVWDTAGMVGQEYEIHALLVANGTVEQDTLTSGNITVNEAPTFALTAPAADTQLPGGGAVTFAWTGVDAEGDADIRIGLDVDTDHINGNEIYIHEDTLADEEQADSVSWDGSDVDGGAVSAGTYHVFVIVDDSVNAVQVVEGNVDVTVN